MTSSLSQIPYVTPTEHRLYELEQRCKPSGSLEDWSQIPVNTLLNLVESLPSRVEDVTAAKKQPRSFGFELDLNGM